jgi:hypothetical protein
LGMTGLVSGMVCCCLDGIFVSYLVR